LCKQEVTIKRPGHVLGLSFFRRSAARACSKTMDRPGESPAGRWPSCYMAAQWCCRQMPEPKEKTMPTDSPMLIVLGLVALAAVWLVFSLVRKLFGILLLIALAGGAWVLWSNPPMFNAVTNALLGWAGAR
jgi:hypothetical protein